MSTPATRYGGIDRFRLIAAVMVVAIHTAPFASLAPVLDVVFTYGLFRVAVPFFFLCSGFFAFAKGQGLRRLARPTIKLARLYLLAVVLYLPLILRAEKFAAGDFLYKLLWQGPFYHLWYFPAAIIGLWLAGLVFRFLPRAAGGTLMGLLYCLGLLGDNALPFVRQIPLLGPLAQGLVGVFGFTRNGLFFAAPFIYAGMVLRDTAQSKTPAKPKNIALLAVGLAAMAAEAYAFYAYTGATPQGSLYLFLPLASIALFCLLLHTKAVVYAGLGQTAMLVYILHPLCIAVLYSLAGRMGLPDVIRSHSLWFFLATAMVSFALAGAAVVVQLLGKAAHQAPPRAQATINLDALRHNRRVLQALLPNGCKTMAVVKADAYGHGAVRVARTLRREGVRRFAVATLGEGVSLRLHGIRGEILVLGYVSPTLALPALLLRLTLTATSERHAHELARAGLPLRVQLKIDTGMHRLGSLPNADTIASLYGLKPLRVKGIYSHLATADSLAPEDVSFAGAQANAFFTLVDALREKGVETGLVHLQSSYGVLNHPEFTPRCDCVRIGLALYGAVAEETTVKPALRPVLSLSAQVVHLQGLPAGTPAGYSRGYRCPANSRLATVSLGYADGLPRNAAGAMVLLNGHKAPIVAVCMDSCFVETAGVPGVSIGAQVVFIGTGNERAGALPVGQLAATAGTIPNEILSRLGRRVPRKYPKKGRDA